MKFKLKLNNKRAFTWGELGKAILLIVALLVIIGIVVIAMNSIKKEGIEKTNKPLFIQLTDAWNKLFTASVSGEGTVATTQATLCEETNLMDCKGKGTKILVDGKDYELTYWQSHLYLYQAQPSAGHLIEKGSNVFCSYTPTVCIVLEYPPTPAQPEINAEVYILTNPEIIDVDLSNCCFSPTKKQYCASRLSCTAVPEYRETKSFKECLLNQAGSCPEISSKRYCCYCSGVGQPDHCWSFVECEKRSNCKEPRTNCQETASFCPE